jgi:hypothetical protein
MLWRKKISITAHNRFGPLQKSQGATIYAPFETVLNNFITLYQFVSIKKTDIPAYPVFAYKAQRALI